MKIIKLKAGKAWNAFQVGKNYLCSEWKQELVTFSEFLERVQSTGCSSKAPTYLAQHQLFDQVVLSSYFILVRFNFTVMY